jgi:aspartyl-tRNA(Asn)/glutamyl-tRNA(Gln) amidotransferase subunit A
MGHDVDDVFLMLEAMADFQRPPAACSRVFLPRNYFFDEIEPGLADLVRAAAERIGKVEAVDLGDVKAAWDANTAILLSDAAAFHEQRLKDHRDWFGGTLAERFGGGLAIRGVDYARARDVQREWRAFLSRLLGDSSVLVVPATPVPATEIGDREGVALSRVMTRFTAPFNLAGVPILSAPAGRLRGLPVGLQIVAAPWREAVLYEAGKRLGAASLPVGA